MARTPLVDPRVFGPQPGDTRWEDLSDKSKEAIIAIHKAALEVLADSEFDRAEFTLQRPADWDGPFRPTEYRDYFRT